VGFGCVLIHVIAKEYYQAKCAALVLVALVLVGHNERTVRRPDSVGMEQKNIGQPISSITVV
jgi:hypothetical protein